MQEAHSREWWRAAVANWAASGQTAAAFASGLGVNPKSLPWWQGKFRREGASRSPPAARFVEVQVPHAAPRPEPAPAALLTLPAVPTQPQRFVARVGATHFEVQVGTDPSYLAALFAAVARAEIPC
jgi:hypothetical protein